MNIGVIGAGLMGTTHIRVLSAAVSGAQVVAVSDASREPPSAPRPRRHRDHPRGRVWS